MYFVCSKQNLAQIKDSMKDPNIPWQYNNKLQYFCTICGGKQCDTTHNINTYITNFETINQPPKNLHPAQHTKSSYTSLNNALPSLWLPDWPPPTKQQTLRQSSSFQCTWPISIEYADWLQTNQQNSQGNTGRLASYLAFSQLPLLITLPSSINAT